MYHFEVYLDRVGSYRWRFRASNGRIIADSGEGYTTRFACEQGIKLVQQHSPSARTQILAY